MTVLVEKSATTLEDGIKTLIESAITDYKKRYGDVIFWQKTGSGFGITNVIINNLNSLEWNDGFYRKDIGYKVID